ncbi:DNA polymerase family A-domain-containing protein [Amanita rubescens]|nr:DNA polymerase family A-domain-containing protein [Amanita rubescens]
MRPDQLLSPALRAQLFLPFSPPHPPPAFDNSLPEHFHRIGLATASPYRNLALDLANASLPPFPDTSGWNLSPKGWTKYYYKHGGASFSEPVPFPVHDGIPESMLVFDVETMPKESASSNAWYAWISPWLLGESSPPAHFIPFGPDTDRLVVGRNVSFDRARVESEYTLAGTRTRWMDTMSLHVAVNGISSHQRPAWNKWKKRETEKVQRVEAVEAMVDLIAQAKEDKERSEEKWKRMDMEDSLQVPCPSEMDWGGNENENDDDDRNRTWESLTSANSLVDVARLHCNIELEQDKASVLNKRLRITRAHKVYSVILPSFLSWCPRPVSFSGVLTIGSSFLTVNSAWERYIERAECVYRGVENEMTTMREWEKDPWLAQLDWTLEKGGKIEGYVKVQEPDEPEHEHEHDALQVLEDPAWLSTLITSPSPCYNGFPLKFSSKEGNVGKLRTTRGQKTSQILGPRHAKLLLASGEMSSNDNDLATALSSGSKDLDDRIQELAARVMDEARKDPESVIEEPKAPAVCWPKWYWDLTKPKKSLPPGTIDLTPRNRIAPLLFKLAWRGYPLFHSREHGWIYRVPSSVSETSKHGSPLTFSNPADWTLADLVLHHGFAFYKLPHKDGEKANVGSPLAKTFVKYAADGVLTSPGGEAKEALELSAVCSYWMSSRDRIMNQMVVWEGDGRKLGFEDKDDKWGIILPQVISMGTVTRRAIEKTWLTASNAKKNRVGSELKAMVRAPPGYAIIGADVDSEELWISSCMGDAQFGMHGATALGWMTLEGTKSAGTDLHSKTAKILGLSRDQAKVFNYSRIYGAGMKHAVLLLLQANAGMSIPEAQKLAENLYASTKGRNTHRSDMFDRKFWFGGSESFVFNKLEEIANSEKPRTPCVGMRRDYLPNEFGSDYMPSRINWVVQSSGVDYLHMLIVSMEYLIKQYQIQARYLISVHDVPPMFAYMLGMDDLPQGVAFFSAVDVDKCLRKEVDMECVTPSQPVPIPPGESLNIEGVLEKTGGSLGEERGVEHVGSLEGYEEPDCMVHRANTAAFLKAQAAQDFGEVKGLAQKVHGVKFEGGIGGMRYLLYSLYSVLRPRNKSLPFTKRSSEIVSHLIFNTLRIVPWFLYFSTPN